MAQINLSWLVQYNELDRHSNVTHALLDSFENVVVAVTNSSKQVGFETNASILKYDATGAQVFKWQRLDSLNGEVVNDLSTDTAGNIYALTYVSNVWQLDTLHLIKIDGTTGQVIFDISVDTNLFNRKMKLYDNHVYVVLGVPQNVILKYDLQGNLIWSKSLVHFFKVLDIQFNRSYMYVIGDSINNNMQRVRCFDTSGVYLWQHLMSYRQFYDAEIDNDGKLWIVGAEPANNKNFVYSLDTLGKLWDTLIYTTSGGSYNARLSFDSQNNIYSGFNVGSTWKGVLELFKIGNYQVTKIAIVDSCFNNISIPSFNGLSMKCLENDDILIASTYYSNVNAPKLYEISRIDSTGNFKKLQI
ncbi:MAG: hypothetical protein IPO27_18220 [Bacteroidetes bacterium]|nr:hypothetical protein [Bacteroidota bacterium]